MLTSLRKKPLAYVVAAALFLSMVSVLLLAQPGGMRVASLLRGSDASGVVAAMPKHGCAVVYGTRPELIKMMPLIRELQAKPEVCRVQLISSGQHKQMLGPLEEFFGLAPDIDLALMRTDDTLAELAARATQAFTQLWTDLQPRMVFVQGDTTTAMAAGVAAFHLNIHVMHVEAGLRTRQLASPYPEEFNRVALGLICTLCFAPTTMAQQALLAEATNTSRVVLTGNTVVDALQYSVAHPPAAVQRSGSVQLQVLDGPASRQSTSALQLAQMTAQLLSSKQHVVLVTAHRRENALSGAFTDIARAVQLLAQQHERTTFVFPLHFNPSVRSVIVPILRDIPNVWLVSPPDYPMFVQVLLRVSLVISDSGGLQEEALALGLPVLIMRDTTERMEGVYAGGAQLIGTSTAAIVREVSRLLTSAEAYTAMSTATNPYGDGTAARRIVAAVRAWQASNPCSNRAADCLVRAPMPRPAALPTPQVPCVKFQAPTERAPLPTPVIKYPAEPKHALSRKPGSLSVVLTGFKRSPAYLQAQLEALEKSTLKPDAIVFFQNGDFANFTEVLAKWPQVKHVHYKNWNSKFHGRFAAAMLLTTEFVAIADDEVVPGPRWLEAAVQQAGALNGIIGNSGRIVEPDSSFTDPKVPYQSSRSAHVTGEVTKPTPAQVDFVGHWWVTRVRTVAAMWQLEAPTLWTAEDIHLSAAAKIALGVNSYVLDVPNQEYNPEQTIPSMSSEQEAGSVASWRVRGTDTERKHAVQYWIGQGWRTIKMGDGTTR